MLLALALVNGRPLGGHNGHPHLERLAEARTTEVQKIAAAGRTPNNVINIQSRDEANEATDSGNADRRTRANNDRGPNGAADAVVGTTAMNASALTTAAHTNLLIISAR